MLGALTRAGLFSGVQVEATSAWKQTPRISESEPTKISPRTTDTLFREFCEPYQANGIHRMPKPKI